MKKLFFVLLILMILIISILSSCGKKSVRYSVINASYRPFLSAQELVESGTEFFETVIFTGKVTGISFQVLDLKTAIPPTEETEETNRRINTIYDIDIITTYKGNLSKFTQIRIDGGLKDYQEEEQMKLIKKMNAWPNDEIPIQERVPEIKIGESYLFVVCQFETGVPTNVTPSQSIYNLRDPFKKNSLRIYDKNNYYTADTDDYGGPVISAKEIISTFGQDKWETFWTQWQKDNPDWETRLDKAEIEKALAE